MGKVGSSSLLLTCVNGMGVVGVFLNLGDFLTVCLAGISIAVAFNGVTGLFLGDDLVALTNPFLSAGISGPRPDFSNGFGFLFLASATRLFLAASDNLSGSFPFFCLPILQRFESILFLISASDISFPTSPFCSDQSRKFFFSILSVNFLSGWMSSIVTYFVSPMCTPPKCFTVSPCICILPSAKPERSAKAAEFGDICCT